MKTYGLNELRKSFLEFFESKGHLAMDSFSLVPKNDNSLLLINAGMAPLKPYFTGQEEPPRRRVCTCQKCIRTGDIENVGKTARHGTFFEMLGNFSFGDYFKKEAIAWSYEYLTKVLEIPEDKLFPSVYEEDDEAFEIWKNDIGIAEDRIFKFGKEDNFWEHGAGPCGPCSEIYYDRGEKYGCGKPDCTVGCECDRYIEVWNNVFTQFNNDGNGNYEELAQKNIDTGMGLERLAVVMQNVDSIFDVDTIKAIRDKVCEIASKKYGESQKDDVSIRVITDHIRSVTFMVSDGILPSNEGRGYVLRRLLRRAARHGRLLGIKGEFLAEVSKVVIRESKAGYPGLEEKQDYIIKLISVEEESFNKTIDQGLVILTDIMDKMEKEGKKTMSGEDAFKLYDTFGFPLDLTVEILEEKGFDADMKGFDELMKKQRDTARNARDKSNYMGREKNIYDDLEKHIETEFVGYNSLSCSSEIGLLAKTVDDSAENKTEEFADVLNEGDKGVIVAVKTPFYSTMGGQINDNGRIKKEDDSTFVVEDVRKTDYGEVLHVGYVEKGSFNKGDVINLSLNQNRRMDIAKNHSATHLLQAALRIVLGEHVHQAGSLVEPDKLRFDFTHFSAMTEEEIKKVEDIVNEEIQKSIEVNTDVMGIEEAKKTGAMALFGEKYADEVRVVKMADFSTELCGGTHVKNTSDIMAFKIMSESGIASGVRRIEALTGTGLMNYFAGVDKEIKEISKLLKTPSDKIMDRLTAMQLEIKNLHKENESLKAKIAMEAAGDVNDEAIDINGVKVVAGRLDGVDSSGMRDLGDKAKEKLGCALVVYASENDGKVSLMATATDSAVEKGIHAGNLIKKISGIVGGGGGGRPNMAQAGGKNPAGIDEALKVAIETAKEMLGA